MQSNEGVDSNASTFASSLASFVDACPVAILVSDQKGSIVLINREAETMFGYAREELLGQPIETLVPPRFRTHHARHRAEFFAGSETRRMGSGRDIVGLRKDGAEFPVEIGLSSIITDHGQLVLSIVVDVSERKRLEQHFLKALEAAPVAFVMTDADGAIRFVNEELGRVFGYEPRELIGQKIEILLPLRFRSQHPRYRDEFFANPQPRRMGFGREISGRRKDGGEFPVEVGLSLIETESGPTTLGTVVDITLRKQLEERLKQSNEELERKVSERTAELTKRNEELEQFAYVASHDLQEPLRKIASCCQLLEEDYADKLDDDGREWIAFAVDGAKRMRQLVSDLLEFSRIETVGKVVEPVSADWACRSAIENLSEAIQESDAQIVLGNLPAVMVNSNQLVQVFQNLIGNSLKYCSGARPMVEINSTQTGSQWQFSVKDNGIGIAPEFHERIFQIFQRLHRKEDYPGTGIGLAMCRKIVNRYGGRLWVESQPEQGSTFYFTLPGTNSHYNGEKSDGTAQSS